jgi:hypothetical protein
MLAATPPATHHYPWTPVFILILILLALSIVRVLSRRPRRIDRSLAVHTEFYRGPDAPRFPEFCSHCRDELGR